MKKSLPLLMVLCLCPALAWAQGTLTGTVRDAATDDPLIGAQVVIPALNLGSVTNIDGVYTVEAVPAGTHVVEIRYIGYRTQRETVTVASGQTQTLDVRLEESAINLDEVVVTGAGGPVEKRKLGNSIATIDAAALETAPIQSFSDVIQGREPGLVGLPSGGLTGEGTRIRIRGTASLSQSNEPIVYIDGVRVDRDGGFGGTNSFVGSGGGGSPSRLDDINPESIERVEVLKGAAAATLYGTEASNGVIQIFTKRGLVGPPRFTFSIQQGAITYPEIYPDQVGFGRSQAQADTMSVYYGRALRPFELVNQNFVHDLFETGYSQTYSASVSGGTPGITYHVSTRWQGENGPFGGDDRRYPVGVTTLADDALKRAQATATLNIFPNDKLQIRVTNGYTDSQFKTLETNNNIYGVVSLAQFSRPERVTFNNQTGTPAFATVNEAMQQTVEQSVQHYNGSVGLNYRPLDILTLDGTFGVDFTNEISEELRPFGWNVDGFSSDTPEGRRRFADRNNLELTFDVKGTLNTQLSERYESSFLFGTQGFISRERLESGQGVDFPGPGFDVTGAASQQALFEEFLEIVNLGVFAQEQFGINNYIFVTAGARLDANSAFGSDFDAVIYPKVSASVIPSDAPFWRPLGPVSSLRFRAAIGRSGLQPGAFDALTTFGALPSITGPGVVPQNLGNPELEPEVSTEWELGTEMGLVNDRVAFETTYWNRTVSDALVDRQFPVTGGFVARQLDNIGEIKAQGVELDVNAFVVNRADVSVNLFANASYLWERVTDLGGAPPIKVGGSYPRYRNFLIEDYAPGANFGAKLLEVPDGSLPVDFNGDGAADTEAEVLAFLATLTPSTASLPTSPSVVLLADDDGDGDPLDHYLGKPTPDWQGAFGGSVKFFRNFTVSTLFEYKTGNYYVNNLTDAFRQANAVIGRNLPESAPVERDYITGGVDAGFNPLNDPNVRLEALETWLNELLALAPFSGLNTIKQADYIRWRELSLTYSAPRGFVQSYGLRNLSFTVAARNLKLWTKYDGIDPELNAVGRGSGSGLDQNFLDGVEAFGFPIPRRFLFTVRFGF
ncbi:MAG: SusC/RagA family TonB-linked outer membrane protein [Rhodothermales bacterium]|nr:SusC/RagA family TonB-linked outer membrane protein [Rhodothermales bacterium]